MDFNAAMCCDILERFFHGVCGMKSFSRSGSFLEELRYQIMRSIYSDYDEVQTMQSAQVSTAKRLLHFGHPYSTLFYDMEKKWKSCSRQLEKWESKRNDVKKMLERSQAFLMLAIKTWQNLYVQQHFRDWQVFLRQRKTQRHM